jgi:hypothetical protein
MTFVMVNPNPIQLRLAEYIKKAHQVDYSVIGTGEFKSKIPNLISVEDWDKTTPWGCGFASNYEGQEFLEDIYSSCLLPNKLELREERLNNYYKHIPFVDDTVVESLSYQGDHAECSVWKRTEQGWSLLNDSSDSEYKDIVQHAHEFLDTQGIVNGPSQVYNQPKDRTLLRMHPMQISWNLGKQLVRRHWFAVLPSLGRLEALDPNIAKRRFNSWISN